MLRLIVLAVACHAMPAMAHATIDARHALAEGVLEVVLAALLVGSGSVYAKGVVTLWRRAGAGRGVRPFEVVCATLGWAALWVALMPPLEALTHGSFALHMVQHEMLMVVAAPLLVLGRPLEAWAWGLSRPVDRSLRRVTRARPLDVAWRAITTPAGAWIFHALSVWGWHVPALFRAALESVPLHILQHGCFLGSALAFWWAAFGKSARHATATSIAALFTTMLHTSALGALLTFAPTVWYSVDDIAALGLTPLEDQQLGGLVMWVPGGLGYMVAGLAIVARWLSPARLRVLVD